MKRCSSAAIGASAPQADRPAIGGREFINPVLSVRGAAIVLLVLFASGQAVAQMSGSYTIKADGSGDYRGFSGAIDALRSAGQNGDVTFHVYQGVYSESIFVSGFINGDHRVVFTGTDRMTGEPTGATLNAGDARNAVYLADIRHFEFRHLKVIGMGGYGFYFGYTGGSAPYNGVSHSVIANCRIRARHGIFMDQGCHYNQVVANDIRATYITISYGIRCRGHGVYVNTGNRFINNAVYGWTTTGIDLDSHADTELFYNTVYRTDGLGTPLQDYSGSGVIQKNNIFRTGTRPAYNVRGRPAVSDYNCFWRADGNDTVIYDRVSSARVTLAQWRTLTGLDSNSINTDPLVVPVTTLPLSPGSPCIGRGTDLSGTPYHITTDIIGDERKTGMPPDGPEIGCNEWAFPGDPLAGAYNVRPDASGDEYESFDAALEAIRLRGQSDDVRFHVHEGTYYEEIYLDGFPNTHRVVFTGTDRQGNPTGAVLDATATRFDGGPAIDLRDISRFEFQHLTVVARDEPNAWAFWLWRNVSDCVIVNCNLRGRYGIYMYAGCHRNRVVANDIRVTGHTGINCHGTSEALNENNFFVNNVIIGWTSRGICLNHHTGTEIYYNTVYRGAGVAVAALSDWNSTNVKLLNNILSAGGGEWPSGYAYYIRHGDYPELSDYNCFWRADGNDTVIYDLGRIGAVPLAQWQAGTGLDSNSIAEDPGVISDTNLRLTAESPCIGAGIPIEGIDTDIEGALRDPEEPCIGAYEYAATGIEAGQAPAGRSHFAVSPNPLTGNSATLRYSLAGPGPVNISVYDVTGRSVLSTRTQTGTDRHGLVSLDMRSLSAGIYLVRVEADGFSATRKLVVQR